MNPPSIDAPPPRHKLLRHVQKRVLAGLLLIVPAVVTIFVASIFYRFIHRLVGPLLERLYALPFWERLIDPQVKPIPGVELFLTVLLMVLMLYILGQISTLILVKRAYGAGERLLLRIPFLKTIYGLTKQAIEMVMRRDKSSFKKMVMLEYPRKGCFAMGFVTGETRFPKDPRLMVNLFVPTTPNPTSGFMLILPAEEIREVDMSIEDGVKLIMSGGVITPDVLPVQDYEPMGEAVPVEVAARTGAD